MKRQASDFIMEKFPFSDLCQDLQRLVIIHSNTTVFSFGCVSKSIANLIEETQVYHEIDRFRGYYDDSYRFPKRLESNTRLIKLKPIRLELGCRRLPDHTTMKAIAPNLTSLSFLESIGESDIHDGMSTIIATMTNLTELSVVDFSNEVDYFTTLPTLPKLKKLTLLLEWCYSEPAPTDGYDWSILKGMTNLESLNARPHEGPLDFSRLTFLTSLKDLYIEIDDLKVHENINCLTNNNFQSLKNIYFDYPIEKDQLHLLKLIPEGFDIHYDVECSYSDDNDIDEYQS